MTREKLRQRLKDNKDLLDLFNEEVAEREAIMSEKENEFTDIKTKALNSTIESWLMKL